jgi:DNA helicase HerA-like ATPase
MSTATPRIFIVGTGESGKTLMAKSIAADMSRRGLIVIIFDPIDDEGWPDDSFQTASEAELFEEIAATDSDGKSRVLFVDEASELMSIGQKENHWLATRGRHYFSTIVFITQRPALVAPTVRNLCNELFCFAVSPADAKLLADDFNSEALVGASALQQGQFLHVYWKDKKRVCEPGKMF